MDEVKNFDELGLSEESLRVIKKKGFEEPSPIQKKIIPLFLNDSMDIIGQAPTGTGKTAAFGLPLLELLKGKTGHIQALILSPTRELAVQVSDEINSLRGRRKLITYPIYGGQSIELQLRRLKSGVDIVVGTPGRVIDHLKRGSLKVDHIKYLILDEADEMLNMGFIDDIKEILKQTNEDKRILLFSATMPREIKNIAKKYMSNIEHITVKGKTRETPLTNQIYFELSESDKFEALCRIRDAIDDFYGLIFCRTKVDVDRVANKLIERGYYADAIHGDLSQYQRERVLGKFKSKKLNMLVATDVAARGIDIKDLTHVINYSLPQDPESYIHRIGRTGRAGKEGTAITFVTPEEYRKMLFIKKIAKANIRKEKLPSAKQLIEIKKERIKEDILSAIESKNYDTYRDFAQDILEDKDAVDVVSALLNLKFQDELSEEKYKDIKEVNMNGNSKARLFVALGRDDGYNPRKLADFIYEKSGIEQRNIREINIFDKFSFITVSFVDAESILWAFKEKARGRRPIVTKAKERKKQQR